MFWKNAKTLKYEYIQRERDVVSVPVGSLGKSALACLCVRRRRPAMMMGGFRGCSSSFRRFISFVSTVVPDAKWNAKRII